MRRVDEICGGRINAAPGCSCAHHSPLVLEGGANFARLSAAHGQLLALVATHDVLVDREAQSAFLGDWSLLLHDMLKVSLVLRLLIAPKLREGCV